MFATSEIVHVLIIETWYIELVESTICIPLGHEKASYSHDDVQLPVPGTTEI
jgi:hypothetical protein